MTLHAWDEQKNCLITLGYAFQSTSKMKLLNFYLSFIYLFIYCCSELLCLFSETEINFERMTCTQKIDGFFLFESLIITIVHVCRLT